MKGEPVGGGRDKADKLAVAVDGLVAPGPDVHVLVEVLQVELDQPPGDALLALFQQRLLADKVLLLKFDLECPVDLVGRGLRRQLLAPKGDKLLNAKESHGQLAHISRKKMSITL